MPVGRAGSIPAGCTKSMAKALITGGAGFIGSNLVKFLLKEGHEVEVWDDLSTGKLERLSKEVKFKRLDLIRDVLPDIEVDWVFHLAAPVSVQESLENPSKYMYGCFGTTYRMLDWSRRNSAKSFTLASTAAVYGETDQIPVKETDDLNPISPYAEWKLKAEECLKMYESYFTCTALRFFNVYGNGQISTGSYAPAVARFLDQYRSGQTITVTGSGLQTRDYVHVNDICSALYESGKRSGTYLRMNVGSGKEIAIIDIAKAFRKDITFIEKRREPMRSGADITLIKGKLAWSPKENIFEWIENNIDL